MKKTAFFLIICLLFSLSGCGSESFPGSGGMPLSMENTPVIDYVAPDATPNILVNRRGYLSKGEKEAAVKGKKLPEEFRLVNVETGEVVYEGRIEETAYDRELGIYVGYASFREYGREGTYYLECDYIGRSYPFAVEKDLYKNLFRELYEEMIDDCAQNTATIEDAMALLRAYEWQGDVFEDENKNKVPDVMEALSKWTERIDYGQIAMSEGAMYAAFLGKFSYLYQSYDLEYATECIQRASGIFSKSQNTLQRDADSFYALTELYRATGMSIYGNQILEYKTYFQNQRNFLEEPGYLYGAMTYMVTRQAVDVELCDLLMDQLLDRGEEIVGLYQEMIQPINARNNGADELLRRVEELSCANYVLKSYQNDCILEEFLDYLMGCNLQSVYFYPEQGGRHKYLNLLAHLASLEMV